MEALYNVKGYNVQSYLSRIVILQMSSNNKSLRTTKYLKSIKFIYVCRDIHSYTHLILFSSDVIGHRQIATTLKSVKLGNQLKPLFNRVNIPYTSANFQKMLMPKNVKLVFKII